MMARETNGGVLRGSVSEEDPLYEKLLLWTDGNHNGISEPEEWRPARDLFSDIGVGYRRCPGGRDESGNLFSLQRVGAYPYRLRSRPRTLWACAAYK